MVMCVGALVHADCLSCCRETSLESMHVLQPLVGCIMSLLALGARSRYSYGKVMGCCPVAIWLATETDPVMHAQGYFAGVHAGAAAAGGPHHVPLCSGHGLPGRLLQHGAWALIRLSSSGAFGFGTVTVSVL